MGLPLGVRGVRIYAARALQARLASAGVVETEPGQTSPAVSIEASVEAAEGPHDGLGMPNARGQSANAVDSATTDSPAEG